MKKVFVLLALCGLLVGCSKYYGEPTTVNIPISGSYSALDVSHAFDVTVSDSVSDVIVTVGEKAVEKLKVEIKDGTLYIGFRRGVYNVGTAKAIIPASTSLEEIDLSGASSFVGNLSGNSLEVELSGASRYNGSIQGTSLKLDISGASSLSGTADVDAIDLEASGSSDVTLTGSCQGEMEIDLSGASMLKASNLETRAVTGELSGSSDAEVTCCERLEVSLSGASAIYYWILSGCTPAVDCQCSGSSTATPRW